MKRRSSNVRKYPPDRIEDARKAIFESGRSVNYKGMLEILKEGSWAPTRVRSLLVSALGLINAFAERILHRARA
jgi:hypothetical protein